MKYKPPVVAIELKTQDKTWVEVTFEGGVVWRPRLWEVGAILSLIGEAEDIKYPTGKGHLLTKEFIAECWGKDTEEIYELVLEQFDPNGVMRARYRKARCIACGGWHDGDESLCEECDAEIGAFAWRACS